MLLFGIIPTWLVIIPALIVCWGVAVLTLTFRIARFEYMRALSSRQLGSNYIPVYDKEKFYQTRRFTIRSTIIYIIGASVFGLPHYFSLTGHPRTYQLVVEVVGVAIVVYAIAYQFMVQRRWFHQNFADHVN